jgi:hypothetical protein
MLKKTIKLISIPLLFCLFKGLMAQGEPIIFSATGDVPYGSGEVPTFEDQITDHNLYSPSEFLVHLGDIKEQTTDCPESYYSLVADILKGLAVPVFIVPGDNETTDCTADPAQAWAYWVQYFMDFELNFCGAPFAERQTARPENFAFISKGVLFIGINLVSGVSSSIQNYDADWVEQQFTEKVSQVRGAVIFSQCGYGSSRSTFFDRLYPAAGNFAKPVLFMNGDRHVWELENPFGVSNMMRIQVDNGGAEEPVQITVTMNDQDPAHMFEYLRTPLNPPVYNVMPCVEAGSDQQINLASTADLQGRATDDGVPTSPGTLVTTWSKISGPGNVTFDNPNDDTTSASFDFPGIYVLRLTAYDGALQNYDELTVEVTDVLVEAKIFLEGPYNSSTGEMTTYLNTSGYIPDTSPYSEDPRSITPPIPADITDWVLVQLRETPSGPPVASRSAFLRKDGRIVADNGITPIITMDVSTDFYYIVIKHRNHLAVMSTGSNQLSNISSTLYDFTSDASQFYGGGAKELEPGSGVWGMYGGNADNSDQDIFASDLAAIKVDFLLGLFGYDLTDVDMDGDVFASDYALGKIDFLLGAFSTVP